MLAMKFFLTGWLLAMLSISLAFIYSLDNILIRIMCYGGFAMVLISALILIWTA